MARFDPVAADRICFAVRGRGTQHFLSAAARAGVRLDGIRPGEEGLTAWAAGTDLPRLRRCADRGGWELEVVSRRGPGRSLARLLRRPGILAGLACFFMLVRLLSGFLWCMDFGGLTDAEQAALRQTLARYGVREGVWLSRETLAGAQQALDLEGEAFGWLSLNFAGGCLFGESTPRQNAEPRAEPQNTELRAKAAGEVLAVDVESGFAQVQPGQYVAKGQLLAAASRLDRSGNPVPQAASGRVVGRVRCSYTAQQPCTWTGSVLTGRSRQTEETCVLGRTFTHRSGDWDGQNTWPGAETRTEWLPLTLGRLALPASVCRTTQWEQAERTLTVSPETAAAMARRSCRLQLLANFPDAVVESERAETACNESGAQCTITYVFRADLVQAETP